MRAGRLDVGIVGAGRVGAVLGAALRQVGHRVVAVSASSEESLERADALLPGVPVREVPGVVAAAQLVLLTVPDDELGPLVAGLAKLGAFRGGQLVAHTAGRFGTEVLAPAADAGAIGLALHPAMTFTGTSLDLVRLHEVPWVVTAAAPMLPIAQALVVELGGEPVVLEEGARITYHAALTHGANHLVTLVGQSLRILRELGVEDPAALVRPLLHASLDGVLRAGEASATGPVVRGDAGTVAAHLAALDRLAAEARNPDGAPSAVAGGKDAALAAGDVEQGNGAEDDGGVRSDARELLGGIPNSADGYPPLLAGSLDDIPATYRVLAAAATDRAQVLGRLRPAAADRIREALRD